jgi:NADPH:quinone reductase-like Zn-dependent oxidoreductase
MKAVVYDRYGPPEVLRLADVPKPVPKEDEVLVRVHATTVSQTDCHMRRARPFVWRFMLGLRRPKQQILGQELAGEVAAVGAAVTDFRVGDRVFGMRSGAHAEYVCVRQTRILAHMPAGMSFEDAAAVYDGAYQGMLALRAAGVHEGQKILVYGASGSCGTACVQLARYHGAHVTAVCDTRNIELMRSLGADEVIDYTLEDFARNGETYDVIIDAVGKRRSFLRNRTSLKPGGVFVPTDGLLNIALVPLTSRFGKKRMRYHYARWSREDLLLLKELIEQRHYRAVVDRVYPLEEAVAAHRYVDSWQKTGNVVLIVNGANNPQPGGHDVHG